MRNISPEIMLSGILSLLASSPAFASDPWTGRVASAIPYLAEDVGGNSQTPDEPTEEDPPQCPVYRMDLAYSIFGCTQIGCRFTGYIGSNSIGEIYDQRTAERPACLDTMIEQIASACSRAVELRYLDDCIVHALQGYRIGQDYRRYPIFPQYADFIDSTENASCAWTSAIPPEYHYQNRNTDRCDAGRVYFDEQCRPVRADRDAVQSACLAGRLRWEASPISLLFDTTIAEFRANARVVQFALEPSRGNWSVWKASANAPLLVYDPEHRGQIRGPEQLFGHWTFGGRQSASLKSESITDAGNGIGVSRWENGFAALASLDRDNDKMVSGAELKGLGLWFDANQNGLSEPGEVQAVDSAGITKLFYAISERDPVTKDLIAHVGFERSVDGKTVTGVAVDWFGETARSDVELTQRQTALGQLCSDAPNGSSSEPNTADESNAEPTTTPGPEHKHGKRAPAAAQISGTWVWESVDGQGTRGVLAFSQLQGENSRVIEGVSILEAEFASSLSNGSRRVLNFLRLQGTADYSADGKPTIQFEHRGNDGLVIKSVATLEDDGKLLRGTSHSEVPGSGGVKLKMKYNWKAARRMSSANMSSAKQ